MKFLRYGEIGQEKPALLGEKGVICDLSAHIDDLRGENLTPEVLSRLSSLECGWYRQIYLHWP